VAALTFLRGSETYVGGFLRERIWNDVTLGVKFLLASQQTSDNNNMRGAVPARFPYRAKFDEDIEVRVDYVQHSMSALIAYERTMLSMLTDGPSKEDGYPHYREGRADDGKWRDVGLEKDWTMGGHKPHSDGQQLLAAAAAAAALGGGDPGAGAGPRFTSLVGPSANSNDAGNMWWWPTSVLSVPWSGGVGLLSLVACLVGCVVFVAVTTAIVRAYYPRLIRQRRTKRRD
jgi:hypothetical protein